MTSGLRGFSFIERFANLTGCTDSEIANLLGMPRSTVQAYRVGRYAEVLSDDQVATLVKAAADYADEVQRVVAEMQMLA